MNVTVERRDFIEEQISQLQGFLLNQDELRKEVMSYFRQFDVNKVIKYPLIYNIE